MFAAMGPRGWGPPHRPGAAAPVVCGGGGSAQPPAPISSWGGSPKVLPRPPWAPRDPRLGRPADVLPPTLQKEQVCGHHPSLGSCHGPSAQPLTGQGLPSSLALKPAGASLSSVTNPAA